MPARPRKSRPPDVHPRRRLLIVHSNQSTNVRSFACRARAVRCAGNGESRSAASGCLDARQFVLCTVASAGQFGVAGGPAPLVSPIPGLVRGLQPVAPGDPGRRVGALPSLHRSRSRPEHSPSRRAGQPALDALETDWADKQTMLKMPEGKQKIDYHLLTAGTSPMPAIIPSSPAPRRGGAASSPAAPDRGRLSAART